MNCMKCGREMEPGQVFCPECLEKMEKCPVKPGTAVVLPPRQNSQARKQIPRKRVLSVEEQNLLLRKHNRRLAYLLIVAIAAIAVLMALTGRVVSELDVKKFWGQNYSTIVNTEAPADTDSTEMATETIAQP